MEKNKPVVLPKQSLMETFVTMVPTGMEQCIAGGGNKKNEVEKNGGGLIIIRMADDGLPKKVLAVYY